MRKGIDKRDVVCYNRGEVSREATLERKSEVNAQCEYLGAKS